MILDAVDQHDVDAQQAAALCGIHKELFQKWVDKGREVLEDLVVEDPEHWMERAQAIPIVQLAMAATATANKSLSEAKHVIMQAIRAGDTNLAKWFITQYEVTPREKVRLKRLQLDLDRAMLRTRGVASRAISQEASKIAARRHSEYEDD